MDKPTNITLTRRVDERIRIKTPSGDIIWVKLSSTRGQQARIQIQAQRDVEIFREELLTKEEIATDGR